MGSVYRCHVVTLLTIIIIFGFLDRMNRPVNKCLDDNDTDCEITVHHEEPQITTVKTRTVQKTDFDIHKLSTYKQTDPELFAYIKDTQLHRPSGLPSKLNTSRSADHSQVGQSVFVDNFLESRYRGFYVECGAGDGDYLSNSVFFETQRNWTGLLIEPNKDLYQKLVSKNRNAHTINACLSPTEHSQTLNLTVAGLFGGLDLYMDQAHINRISAGKSEPLRKSQVTCFPLYSILKALGRTHIDYFSLDVEGPEVDILETLPLGDGTLTVDVFSIEYRVTGDWGATYRKARRIMDVLVDRHGYRVLGYLTKQDIVLAKVH